MKTVLACALLALVPFTSLRMVCVDSHVTSAPARVAGTSDATTAAAEAEDECARICTHRPAPPAAAPAPATSAGTCLLIPDPACEYLTTAAVAIMPRAPSLLIQYRAVRLDPPAADGYVSPVLARRSPPPRVQA
jgi:hypothetical protein